MRTFFALAVVVSSVVVLLACQKESVATPAAPAANAPAASAPVATAATAAAQPAVAQPPAAAPLAAAGDKQYRIEAAEVRLKVGATATAKLVIKAAAGLHFNREYPAKFTVAPTAFAKSTKDKLSSKTGEVQVEGNDGVVSVPLQGLAAGAGTVEITGSFSVCSDEQCYMLRDEKLSLKVVVQ